MFTGRRPRAFQFKCCVGKAILGQAWIRRKMPDPAVSENAPADLATTVIFTDGPLLAEGTRIKAVHLTQLRTAINAVRGPLGGSPRSMAASWSRITRNGR